MLDELVDGAKRNPIWFGAVATITGVQGFFAWEFWGAVSHDPVHQLALRSLGLGFVAGEVVALDMASRADLAHEPKRASTLRSLWFVLAVTTFTADINALSGVLRDGDGVRAEAAAQYDARQAHLRELERQIDEADDPYAGNLLSVSAYEAAIAGKSREIAAARHDGAPGSQRRRLEAQLTDLQAAHATALEVAAWERERAALLAMPATHATRPDVGPEEFRPFAEMATNIARSGEQLLGQEPRASVSGEDVRQSMAWIATIAMKLMLTFGVWVGLQRSMLSAPKARDERADAETECAKTSSEIGSPSQTPSAPPASPLTPAPLRAQPRRRTPPPIVLGRGGARFPR